MKLDKRNNLNKQEVKELLKEARDRSKSGFVRAVTKEAFKNDGPKVFFRYLAQGGCISGMINSLIWYEDTRAFFDEHYEEIEMLRQEIEEQCGQPITIEGDLKNCLAWFAFEETARQMADEKLGLEV